MQECLLRELPKVLLGRVWPEHRVLMGLRVCKWLQADLQSHAAGALLIVIFQEATILDRIRATLRRLRGCKIYLDGQMLCPPQTDEIFSGIAGIAGQQPAMLVHLDLRKADVGCTEPGLLNVLNVCTALEFLDLSDAGNVEKQWSDVFKSLGKTKGLKHLGIGGTFIDDGSAASLKALLTETSNLTSLNMDRTGFDSILIEGISQAMARHTSLTRLNVRFVEMGASNASELCGMLRNQKRLHHLDMDAIEMGNEGAEKLCETLAGCSELRFLDVGVNSIQGATACRLGMSLASLSRLASLSVSGNAFGDAGIRCLCSAVAGFQSLTALNLRWLPFAIAVQSQGLTSGHSRQTALGAEACSPDCLGAVLRQCPKLLRLDVTWNEAIGDQGALALAASLRESRSLMDLDSAWCGIGTDGARALVAALVATPTIVVADMQMNRIPLPEAKRLDAASRAIEGGRDFTLRILAQTKVPDPAAAAR